MRALMTTTLLGAVAVGGCNLLASGPGEAEEALGWSRTSRLSTADVRLTDDVGPDKVIHKVFRFFPEDGESVPQALRDVRVNVHMATGRTRTDTQEGDESFPREVLAPRKLDVRVTYTADDLEVDLDCDAAIAVGLPEPDGDGALAYGDDEVLFQQCALQLTRGARTWVVFLEGAGDGHLWARSLEPEILEVLD